MWVEYTETLAQSVWNRVKGRWQGSLWAELEGRSFLSFDRSLRSSDMLCDFGFGLGRVTRLVPGHMCGLHAVFWSKDAFRDVAVVNGAIRVLMLAQRLVRVESIVPDGSRSLKRYMERLGFMNEGTLHNWYKSGDGFPDGCMFALLGGSHG